VSDPLLSTPTYGELPHVVVFMLQSYFRHLSGWGVQHRQGLLASVQITSYKFSSGTAHLASRRAESTAETEAPREVVVERWVMRAAEAGASQRRMELRLRERENT
jgi:hypothetical protein